MEVTVRLAAEDDLGTIGRIFNYYIENPTCTFHLEPMTAAQYAEWFRDRTSAHPVTVAESQGIVVGWASLSPWKPRQAHAHSVEGSVYVDHQSQRQGVGHALLSDLIQRARSFGHRTLIGGACSEHSASLALQDKFGFTEVGTLKEVGNKFDRWLDVTHTQLLL